MAIYSVFLDKDDYYDKNIEVNKHLINNLANIVNVYLEFTADIDEILIAGSCYGKNDNDVEELIKTCFGDSTKKKYSIGLISKYRGFSVIPTNNAIVKIGHIKKTGIVLKGHSDHRKMIFFLSKTKPMAVLIGSSNFSPNTYLKNSSSEADMLLLNYKSQDNSSTINKKIIKYLEYICNNENNYPFENFSSVIISKSLNDNDQLNTMYLKTLKSDHNITEINLDEKTSNLNA